VVFGARQDEEQVGQAVEVTMIFGSTSASRASVTTERSARRQTVRAWCRSAAAGVPLGSTNDRRSGSFSSRESMAFSRRRTWAAVTTALARFAATLWLGSASWAPMAKRSFWTEKSRRSSGSGARARTAPSAAFVSSTSP
jgi:hypothetical protein